MFKMNDRKRMKGDNTKSNVILNFNMNKYIKYVFRDGARKKY